MEIQNQLSTNILRAYPKGNLADYLRSQNYILARGPKLSQGDESLSSEPGEHEAAAKKKRRHRRAKRNGTVTLNIEPENRNELRYEPTTAQAHTYAITPRLQEQAVEEPSHLLWPVTSYPGMFGLVPYLKDIIPVNLLIDHYLQTMAVPIPALDQDSHGLLRSKWFPLAVSSPAPLLSVLLTAAAHFISGDSEYATMPSSTEHENRSVALLSLKQLALQQTNALLSQPAPEHNTSDAAIAAVAKLASYEAIYGDIAAYRMHMRGLWCMVARRDAHDPLGTTLDGLLLRMVLWIDANCAYLLREKSWFGAKFTEPPLAANLWIADPDMAHFLAAK